LPKTSHRQTFPHIPSFSIPIAVSWPMPESLSVLAVFVKNPTVSFLSISFPRPIHRSLKVTAPKGSLVPHSKVLSAVFVYKRSRPNPPEPLLIDIRTLLTFFSPSPQPEDPGLELWANSNTPDSRPSQAFDFTWPYLSPPIFPFKKPPSDSVPPGSLFYWFALFFFLSPIKVYLGSPLPLLFLAYFLIGQTLFLADRLLVLESLRSCPLFPKLFFLPSPPPLPLPVLRFGRPSTSTVERLECWSAQISWSLSVNFLTFHSTAILSASFSATRLLKRAKALVFFQKSSLFSLYFFSFFFRVDRFFYFWPFPKMRPLFPV